jgi:hypothetical protein
MLFNSFTFLAFFTIVVVLYSIIPHRFRWLMLLAASLYFYYSFDAGYLILLLAAIAIVYAIARGLGAAKTPLQRKLLLAFGIIAALSPLVIFKYFDFIAESLGALLINLRLQAPEQELPRLGLLLPAGLSFYTFTCVSYLVDVYRGKLAPERHLGRLALYVSFFPKLLAGPIERAANRAAVPLYARKCVVRTPVDPVGAFQEDGHCRPASRLCRCGLSTSGLCVAGSADDCHLLLCISDLLRLLRLFGHCDWGGARFGL